MKKLVMLTLLAASLHAEAVFFTPKSKVYHKKECAHLVKAQRVLSSTRFAAWYHGLLPCSKYKSK